MKELKDRGKLTIVWMTRCGAWISLFSLMIVGGTAQASAADLPSDVVNVLRKQYVSPGMETRYLSGAVDLNGDGKAEMIVYVVGPMACGTGGCPTLVFTPKGAGFGLVSSISITRPPIRVSAGQTKGWRNLIVHVSGGGAKAADVELMFDGKSYPTNPTGRGNNIKTASLAGSKIVIDEFGFFTDAKPLPSESRAGDAASKAKSGPSFDCQKATTAAQKLICNDTDLADMDGRLGKAYAKGQKQWPAEAQAKERDIQRVWMTERNACVKSTDAKSCMKSSYQKRLVELQIRNGELEVPKAVGYVCKGFEREPFQAVFYNHTDPPSAVVTFGNRQEILFISRTASGARYVNPRVDFWEHHGEAAVVWSGKSYECKTRRRGAE